MAIYGQESINGSVKWLGVPAPFCDTGVAGTENILVPSPHWGDRVGVGYWDWVAHSGVIIRDDVPWRSALPARPDHLPRSPPENACATARRVRDALLREHRLTRAQNVLYAHQIDGVGRVNCSDDDWDDLWDEPADQ